jgi:hypothetical protein
MDQINTNQLKGILKLDKEAIMKHRDLKMIVFSYLTGAELYHKISCLDKVT